jgi:hypothetical protein
VPSSYHPVKIAESKETLNAPSPNKKGNIYDMDLVILQG